MNTKAPYNISTPTASLALSALSASSLDLMRSKVDSLKSERAKLLNAFADSSLTSLGIGKPIGGNDANFVLVPILSRPAALGADRDSDSSAVAVVNGEQELKPDNVRAQAVYIALAEVEGVVIRFRGHELGCEGCVRVTVGTPEENEILLRKLTEVLGRM
jgi:histidinol-phosphate aminotransferase